MLSGHYQPVYEIMRGETVESIHFGSIAVVGSAGNLIASVGNPETITYLRSSAKPIQVLPFLQQGGKNFYDLSQQEIAIMCASHSATDEHLAVLNALQTRLGIAENELLCGTHAPYDIPSADKLVALNVKPTPNHHNCSGKHTGMLAFVRMKERLFGTAKSSLTYIDMDHPIQQDILQVMAYISGLEEHQVHLGIDGCSAPNFAVPLINAALAFARLCDPKTGRVEPPGLRSACSEVVEAMMSHPNLVGGPKRFDTRLMEVTHHRIITKSGAEGYQAIGLLPGAITPGSPSLGIAIKISDGDQRRIAKSAVSLEVLRQLNALSEQELGELKEFGPIIPIENWRGIQVGVARPVFSLS